MQSSFLVVACVLTATAAAAASGRGGGEDRGRNGLAAAAVKRSDPRCPADGCAAVRCPRDRDACLLGLAPDGCGCCPYGVCGLGVAAECNGADRPCAERLECVKTEVGGRGGGGGGDRLREQPTYRCSCKEKEPVCGTDNRTYGNSCQLNEAAALQTHNGTVDTIITLSVQSLGPCHSAPVIRSVPKNFAGTIGQPVVFDCEVNGYPVPSISWRYVDKNGIHKWLPGDNTLMTIQTRGGPDRFTVTSWVQIMEFRVEQVGNYTCQGENSIELVTATAVLDIIKMT